MARAAIYILVLLTLCALHGCKKITARKLSGTYFGTIREYNETPFTLPTDVKDEGHFIVSRNKKMITSCGVTIHQDSLADGFYSYPNTSGLGGFHSIQIKDDSVIVINYSKYKFGYIQFNEYRGVKETK